MLHYSKYYCYYYYYYYYYTLQAYAEAGKTNEALFHYHTALTLSPNYEPARIGLERLEKKLKGV